MRDRGYGWREIECNRCKTLAIPLGAVLSYSTFSIFHHSPPKKQKPRLTTRAFSRMRKRFPDQAAGFNALALIGSAVLVALFLGNSPSSFACIVKASYCWRVGGGHSSRAPGGGLMAQSSCPQVKVAGGLG